jgi:putative tryptophan/tyrosine transport system substrate-binding protein
LNRRDLLILVSTAIALPLAARAQQKAMPVVGYLVTGSPGPNAPFAAAFREGLRETGYVEGQNLAIEYRWAEGHYDRLPALAADLVARNVDVIAAAGDAAALAAKNASSTIPIVFFGGGDPVAMGLVTSFARPGGNLTGINFFSIELAAKRLELLRELVPGATRITVLVNPADAPNTESALRGIEPAARSMGLQIQVLNASTIREIDAAFATLVSERPDALFVANNPFFIDRRVQLALLAVLHRLPAIYQDRLNAEVGGLMSYGASLGDAYRDVGTYTGRILKGAQPADLPVVQSSKFEFVINASTARMLGLTVPDKLLVAADEVIE